MSSAISTIIGIDEVGRGPIAGPVCVCACKIDVDDQELLSHSFIIDSKKLSRKKRALARQMLLQLESERALQSCISLRDSSYIDAYGITQSIKECINDVLNQLDFDPFTTHIYLDGSLYAPEQYSHQSTHIAGDATYKIISAASIIAKEYRDNLMNDLHKEFPNYEWNTNKGYGTKSHYYALNLYGTTMYHRISFL